MPDIISKKIVEEVWKICPELSDNNSFTECILRYVELSGRKIVFIIDEWDSVIRESKGNEQVQEKFLNLLRGWFKNGNFTPYQFQMKRYVWNSHAAFGK